MIEQSCEASLQNALDKLVSGSNNRGLSFNIRKLNAW